MNTLRSIGICAVLLAAAACSEESSVVEHGVAEETSANASPQLPIEDDRCRLTTALTSGPDDCPTHVDDDHDGVDDGEDLCPDTTPGVDVDASGCARATTPANPTAS